ncbi:MAG: hypothetical protein ACRD7E_29070, partial [Bryobacteraceae bacterium]
MPPKAGKPSGRGPEDAREAIERFLEASKQPVLVEPGEDRLLLERDSYHLDYQNGRLTIQAWNRERNLVRRITGIETERPGRLDLITERFGKKPGNLQLLDLDRPQNQAVSRRGERLAYREHFRRSLSRQFPGWRIADLSAEPDLEHSLSPSYPRAFLRKGPAAWAAIGAPQDQPAIDGVLSFGLIWLDYLRRRERLVRVEGLAVFLPAGHERTTCLRVLHLNPEAARFLVFAYSKDGYEEALDLKDYGNLDTKLVALRARVPEDFSECDEWVERIACLPGVEQIEAADGTVSLRVNGLEFARQTGQELFFGLETKHLARASNLSEIEALAREVIRVRSSDAADRQHRLYSKFPERWLESQVRRSLVEIDAGLLPKPVYG